MSRLLGIGICLLALLLAEPAQAEELNGIGDATLVDILSNFEVLAEHKKPPYAIRVLRLREHGECDGPPESCPQAILYITASTFDEDPDQQVYKLPKAYDWEFVRWKSFAQNEGRESFTILEVRRKDIGKVSAKGGKSDTKYEVLVNPWNAHLQESQQ